MTFVKTPGPDPMDVAADKLGEAVAEKAGGKVEEIASTAEAAAGVAKAAAAGGLKTAAMKAVTTVAQEAVKELAHKVPGLPGGVTSVGGGVAGKVGGIVADHEMPVFEERAITSFSGGPAGSLAAQAQGVVGKIARAIFGQQNLELEVATGDPLDVRNFSVQERLSSLFAIDLVVVSENASVDFDAVVGHPARFTVHAGAHDRFWSGICNRFEQVRVEPGGLTTYQVSIVPVLWFLTQRKNYRMFQQISEPDIVLEVLGGWDIKPVVRIDRGAYKKRKYRVQYGETDFAFVSRMLEDVGITYLFEQDGDETKLVLTDAPHKSERRVPALTFLDDTSTARNVDFATAVRVTQRVRPGKYTMRDHDYRRPPTYKLLSSAAGGRGMEEKLERYHYTPGAFLFGTDQGEATPHADDRGKTRTDEKEAAALTQKRLDAKRGSARVCTFVTNAHDLGPGMVLSISGHPLAVLDEKSLLVVESSLSGTSAGEWMQHCEARSTEVPYRPELSTPKPKVNGVESATVVGPPGEEIHTDEFGRVRVHFHWDRESKMDERSSCWLHVSQPWGGSGYGGVNLPRIGQEVLVDFFGGDPDRPVIVGRVYTNLQRVPYKLPDSKTQSGWRSNSTGGGGGYNEIMFEDGQGRELVNIQAQKDLNKLVKNNETETTGVDRTIGVGQNRSAMVGKKDTSAVGELYSVTIVPPPPPGGMGPPAPATTVLEMVDKKISLTTGKASIVLDGPTIYLVAEENIILGAKKVVQIDGTEAVYINCTEPPPNPLDQGSSIASRALQLAGVAAPIATALGFPVVGAVLLGASIIGGWLSR